MTAPAYVPPAVEKHDPVRSRDANVLQTRTAVAYASLAVPITAVGVPIAIYLPPLYATEVGLGLASVGFLFMVARIWDVVTDPAMGIMIDRFPSRWGCRKHWIVMGAPLLMVSAWFLYVPSREPHSAAYLFTWLFLLYLAFTLIDIAHKSWGPDLATRYDDRSRLFGWREAVNVAGTIGVLLVPAILERFQFDAFDKAASMGIFLILTLPVATAIVLRYVPDRRTVDQPSAVVWSELVPALRNGAMVRILTAECFVAIGVGATGAMYLFVAEWVFELESYGSLGLIIFFVCGMVAVPAWVRISANLGKHGALVIAATYWALASGSFLLVGKAGSLAALLGLSALVGFGFTGPQVLVRSMVADAVDQEELRSGHNRSGLYFAAMSTVYKLGSAVSVGLAYLILVEVGFDPAVENAPGAVQGLLLTFVLLPMTFALMTAVCMWKYPLTRARHERIRRDLSVARPGS